MASNLLEELANLHNPAPASFDPEDAGREDIFGAPAGAAGGEAAEGEIAARGQRTHRVKRLDEDPKYRGRKTSRRALDAWATAGPGRLAVGGEAGASSSGSGTDGAASGSASDLERDGGNSGESGTEGSFEGEESGSELGGGSGDEFAGINSAVRGSTMGDLARQQDEYRQLEAAEAKAVSDLSKQATSDLEKGKHARNQCTLWEAAMEARIRLQKATVQSNRLPAAMGALVRHPALKDAANGARAAVVSLLHSTLDLQEGVLEANPATAGILGKRDRPSDLQDVEAYLAHRHSRLRPFVEATVDKWNTKTKLAGEKSFKALNKSVLKQIEEVMSDRERLLERTRRNRGDHVVISTEVSPAAAAAGGDNEPPANSANPEEVLNVNIFDDTDFYHDLLRDLIERKADVSALEDPMEMGRHWVEINRMRKKMKKKVDTKASKGRKLRYDVHPKLVGFMPPNTTHETASEEARQDLFESLFGRSSS